MEIKISNSSLIEEVQRDFNEFFPFLRLKFLPNNKFSTNAKALSPGVSKMPFLKFGDLNNNLLPGTFDISDATTVKELEDIFKTKFGINIQVLRKSGNIWMEATSMTGNWSLSQHNEHGREISAVGG